MPLVGSCHPEFGYLCPSSGLRRNLRLIVVAGAFGFIVGAATVGFRSAHQDTNALHALAFADPELNAVSGEKAGAAIAPAKVEPMPLPATPTSACRDATQQLGDDCRFGRTRKHRMVRVPTERPTTGGIPIGRAEPAPAAEMPIAEQGSTERARVWVDPMKSKQTAEGAPDAPMPVRAARAASHKVRRAANRNPSVRHNDSVYASSRGGEYEYRRGGYYGSGARMVFW